MAEASCLANRPCRATLIDGGKGAAETMSMRSSAWLKRRFPAVCMPAFLLGFLAPGGSVWGQAKAVQPVPAAAMAGPATSPNVSRLPLLSLTNDFRGGQPSHLEIRIQQDGHARAFVRQTPEQNLQTLSFTASPAFVQQLFQLAGDLHDFQGRSLESKSKVAYMGTKTFRYQAGGHSAQQSFNFTTVRAAAELNILFNRLSTTVQHALQLQLDMQYDPLGVAKELRLVMADYKGRQLAQAQLLRPILQRIVEDPDSMHLARKRARQLLDKMQ